jgi:hypothetical protein
MYKVYNFTSPLKAQLVLVQEEFGPVLASFSSRSSTIVIYSVPIAQQLTGQAVVPWRLSLKRTVSRDFDFCFFHESVSPKLLSIPLGPFRIFSKIRGDIRSSRFATGVVDPGGKCKKS